MHNNQLCKWTMTYISSRFSILPSTNKYKKMVDKYEMIDKYKKWCTNINKYPPLLLLHDEHLILCSVEVQLQPPHHVVDLEVVKTRDCKLDFPENNSDFRLWSRGWFSWLHPRSWSIEWFLMTLHWQRCSSIQQISSSDWLEVDDDDEDDYGDDDENCDTMVITIVIMVITIVI